MERVLVTRVREVGSRWIELRVMMERGQVTMRGSGWRGAEGFFGLKMGVEGNDVT